jgi:proline dehydrogenase
MYTNSYNSKGNHLQGIIFKQTLDNFIDLMFSKPVNNTTYEEIESKVQTIAENL